MRKHGIVLDFKRNQVRIGDKELPTLREDADEFLQIRRQAMRNRQDMSKEREKGDNDERRKGNEQ